jgi:type IV fimbrial biogenesis protein FimT
VKVSRARGFTLVELMIGIAILGVVAMLAAPSFSAFIARAKLRGAANEVYADLQYARSEAVEKNQVFQVEFSSSGYDVWRMSRTAPTTKDASTTAAPNPVKSVLWTDSGTSVTSGSSMVVTFNPVRATATVTNGPLVLSNPAISGTLQLGVGVTGRAELCSPSGSITGVTSC